MAQWVGAQGQVKAAKNIPTCGAPPGKQPSKMEFLFFFISTTKLGFNYKATLPGPGHQPLGGSISLKFLLETRRQSESLILWMTCWGFGFISCDVS